MKRTYSKKQIQEAIAYWEKQLKSMNESTSPSMTADKISESVYSQIQRAFSSLADAERMLKANMHFGPYGNHVGDVMSAELVNGELCLTIQKDDHRGPVAGAMTAQDVLDEMQKAGSVPVYVFKPNDALANRLGQREYKSYVNNVQVGEKSGIWLRP